MTNQLHKVLWAFDRFASQVRLTDVFGEAAPPTPSNNPVLEGGREKC